MKKNKTQLSLYRFLQYPVRPLCVYTFTRLLFFCIYYKIINTKKNIWGAATTSPLFFVIFMPLPLLVHGTRPRGNKNNKKKLRGYKNDGGMYKSHHIFSAGANFLFCILSSQPLTDSEGPGLIKYKTKN